MHSPQRPALWKFWYWPLHWQIIGSLIAGLLFGLLMIWADSANLLPPSFFKNLVSNWFKPFGVIFVNSLKLIAIPLILASLIKGVSDLQDMSRLSSMGGRTIVIYLISTLVAVSIGLTLANLIRPGQGMPAAVQQQLLGDQSAADRATQIAQDAKLQSQKGPLQSLIDVVPDNLFKAASNNGNMLQIIFWALFFGVAMILLPVDQVAPVKNFIDSCNQVILKMIDLIMIFAPLGVFALMASLVTETSDWRILLALIKYGLTVILGLVMMMLVVYPSLVVFLGGIPYTTFLKGMMPAQLLAFTTSSSAATLPVTIECVEQRLGVDPKVASFVLPIGATINMDGTSLYQAVAAVFIAQVLGIDLSLQQQITIILTATMASIGSAAVPGAGMVMLVIVLSAVGIPESGLALIIAVDRILDMCRTTVNVTGDAAVAVVIANSQKSKPRIE